MAGTSVDFDAAEFVASIRATMMMGLPKEPELRPIFHFPFTPDYEADPLVNELVDEGGEPYDWNGAKPTTPAAGTPEPKEPVLSGDEEGQVLLAVAAAGSGGEEQTAIGDFNSAEYDRVFLDVDWPLVQGFTWVSLGGNRYEYVSTEPQIGLFEVTLYIVRVAAGDES